MRPFHSRLEDLPRILPIFPLSGALLLPQGKLPLNVFEPRYLALVQDCLAWGRILGMIQPNVSGSGPKDPPVFDTGCAGRISAFNETEDGRLLVTLTGVCRFRVAEEIEGTRGYRRVMADWTPFADDLAEDEPDFELDRAHLLTVLRSYLKLNSMDINWKAIETASDLSLTVSLAMLCPFEPREKQALLESPNPDHRAQTLVALMEMALAESVGGKGHPRQ
ncbi:LON peptidase substrate-binding domain-containing protein [Telmatospirillum sp.]|uniref:LON peptidase substrate-binding domain-containing protein n=1 Tax=Telmatospirillum sp. TaxID=2079197 RepID=UPI00283CDA20|nr:LON peptidase substrate-binding domain-containing protein [Telmatospirillum sp.]MDR3440660.1 LON peptidase substrate-binding domain-containing protein [Telmatospirillum sp.]